MLVTFYKGVLCDDLKSGYVPGSVTTDIREALMWKERIGSNKQKGAAKHVRHGKSCIIKIVVDTTHFLSALEFQREGVAEHKRQSCWMNAVKSKAQINEPQTYTVLSDSELNNFSLL